MKPIYVGPQLLSTDLLLYKHTHCRSETEYSTPKYPAKAFSYTLSCHDGRRPDGLHEYTHTHTRRLLLYTDYVTNMQSWFRTSHKNIIFSYQINRNTQGLHML